MIEPVAYIKKVEAGVVIQQQIIVALLSPGITVNSGTGPSTDPTIVSRIAVSNLSGHVIVFSDTANTVEATDIGVYNQCAAILGMPTGASTAGNPIEVKISGVITEPSWSWVEGDVWLAGIGGLTQAPPLTGLSVKIGTAISSNSIQLKFDPIINMG